MAAWVCRGELPPDKLVETPGLSVQLDAADLAQVIYVDHYGNAMTGLRAGTVPVTARLSIAGVEIEYARVFSDAMTGQAFWYENSIGLVEIAVNRGSAASQLGVHVGNPVQVNGGRESAT
jgi:S-adenosylmethionine hydrolase